MMQNLATPRRSRAASLFKKEIPADSEVEAVEETPLRPKMREDDPRARAAQRARELREHSSEAVDGGDDFYVDLNVIPDGWTYEWKRHSTYGQEDPSYQIQLARAGWTAVPLSRHPEMMPYGYQQQTILRKGMILMECPTEIVEERRRHDLQMARAQVRHKEQQIAGTPDGTLTRDDSRVRPKIKKSYEAMPIPEE
jgi:hypothetical protein